MEIATQLRRRTGHPSTAALSRAPQRRNTAPTCAAAMATPAGRSRSRVTSETILALYSCSPDDERDMVAAIRLRPPENCRLDSCRASRLGTMPA